MPELDDVINDAAPDAEFAAGDKLLGRSAATGGVASFDPDSVFDPLRAEIAAEYAPRVYPSGRYHATPSGTLQTGNLVLDRNVAIPLMVGPTPRTLDRIAISVVVAGTAGAVHRLGIYDDDGDGLPGELILDAGTVDCTTTGEKEIEISQSVSGRVWLCAATQGALSTVRLVVGNNELIGNALFASTFLGGGALQHVGVSGALPSTFSVAPSPRANAPLMAFRFA